MPTTSNGLTAGGRVRRKRWAHGGGTIAAVLHTSGTCARCIPPGEHVLVQWDDYALPCDEDPKDLEPEHDGEVKFVVCVPELHYSYVEINACDPTAAFAAVYDREGVEIRSKNADRFEPNERSWTVLTEGDIPVATFVAAPARES
jgi:hypothetical protein